jgi:dGTPase
LATNDHIHNRLTHSLEVSSVGRSLGNMVGYHLEEKGILPDKIKAHHIGEIVHAACLAHDIGNPPFGHAGESALQNWFQNSNHSRYIEPLTQTQRSDFNNFDGNAQSFRIATVIEYNHQKGGMRLTYPTLAAMVKYPVTSHHSEEMIEAKFGFYESESNIFLHMAKVLELGNEINNIKRHPLSFLAEAADDICYNLIDLEDAHEMKIISVTDIFNALQPAFNGKSEKEILNKSEPSSRRQVGYLRSRAIGVLIEDTVKAFVDNLEAITFGNFAGNIIDATDSRTQLTIRGAKDIARKKIFKEIRKVTLEIGAYTVFERLFDVLIPAAYERVFNRHESFKTARAIDLLGINAPTANSNLYSAYQAVIDFVAGMTDDYATFISSQFSGAGK